MASQPKDAVPGDETVQVPQYLINGTDVKSIDFGAGTKLSWVGGPCQPKPPQSRYTNLGLLQAAKAEGT